MSDKLNILQKKINIKFKDLNYLKKSITHKSFDATNNYEKLEFLGDRILGLVISKKLIELFPNEKEGFLDKKLGLGVIYGTVPSELEDFKEFRPKNVEMFAYM